jgi:hypothetical protein
MSESKHVVELGDHLRLSITDPEQYWAYPFVIAGNDGVVRVSLSQIDAIKVLHALMKIYPLDVLAGV